MTIDESMQSMNRATSNDKGQERDGLGGFREGMVRSRNTNTTIPPGEQRNQPSTTARDKEDNADISQASRMGVSRQMPLKPKRLYVLPTLGALAFWL